MPKSCADPSFVVAETLVTLISMAAGLGSPESAATKQIGTTEEDSNAGGSTI
jgi:hypothetical protein